MAGNHLVQSIQRAVDILQCVAASEDGVTLQEISRQLGLKPPTVHNIARTLTVRKQGASAADALRPHQRLPRRHMPEDVLVRPPVLALQQIERARPAQTQGIAVVFANWRARPTFFRMSGSWLTSSAAAMICAACARVRCSSR